MEQKLKNAFKETPSRFRYTVNSAVTEAAEAVPQKPRISKAAKILLATILILALVPTAIFGASKIINGISAEKEGSYGVRIIATAAPDAVFPEYIKMTVKTPEGFGVVPNTDGRKFYNLSTEKPYTDGFTIDPFRPNTNGIADIADYADSYEETTIAGHTAYKIISTASRRSWERIYVYYEDVNVMVLIYYKDVTEKQLNDFIAGITVTEGTAADHTDIGSYYNNIEKEDAAARSGYVIDNEYIEKPLDTEFTFASCDENGIFVNEPIVSCKVTGVRTLDNISELDQNGFNDLYPRDQMTDENGNLLPHTREVWQYGDGITTDDKLLDSAEVDQKLLLVDFSYTNLTDKDMDVYIPWRLSAMVKDESDQYRQAEIFDKEANIAIDEYCSSELCYMSRHGEGKSYYSPALAANETKTITIGFTVDADMLDKFYLIECPSADNVCTPDYPTRNPYTYFLMKVL